MQKEYFEAVITNVKDIPGFEGQNPTQFQDTSTSRNFDVLIQNGPDIGKTYEVYSNGLEYSSGERVFIQKITEPGQESYIFLNEKIRLPEIFFSVIFFMLVVVLLFGKKGIKSILSLIVSFIIIFSVLIPMTLSGYNPILVAGFISLLLLSAMMFITNGRNQITYSALIGCTISVFITIILSYLVVESTSITGKVDETWSYFNNYLDLNLNFSLIVIASMIIGVIGAVDDGAITQASVVKELKETNPHLTVKEYYTKAMNVGRDHAGAMINTLVLAYVASAIPLLMLIYKSDIPLKIMINQEIIATEIFRATIGSVGLLLAIPLTTLIAVYLIKPNGKHMPHHGHTH